MLGWIPLEACILVVLKTALHAYATAVTFGFVTGGDIVADKLLLPVYTRCSELGT